MSIQIKNTTELSIVHSPGVCGGRAIIAGTRIPVWTLHKSWLLGATDTQLLQAYPVLTEHELHAARLYVQIHREEINKDIQEQVQYMSH
jgi:type III restriction enzyme